jgi:hypothetical protein
MLLRVFTGTTRTNGVPREIEGSLRMKLKSRLAALLTMAAVATVAAIGLAAPASAQTAAAPFCGQYWGSLPKESNAPLSEALMLKVRTGQHECFDRMVIDIAGSVGHYDVRYDVNHTMFGTQDIATFYGRGSSHLVIDVKNKVIPAVRSSYGTIATESGEEAANVSGFRTFRQIKELIYGGSGPNFDIGDVFLLGVRAHLPFRVFTLAGPGTNNRLVIDVAHRW